jgi:hypothetical protein
LSGTTWATLHEDNALMYMNTHSQIWPSQQRVLLVAAAALLANTLSQAAPVS